MNIQSQNFDYIILGSGPAGSTVANFLDSSDSIALIDSGSVKKSSSKIYPSKPFYINNLPNFYVPQYSNVFGGNSELWSNKSYLIHERETQSWPISHSELLKYSRDLALKLNINHDRIYKTSNYINKSFFHRSSRLEINNIFEFYNIQNKKNIKLFENFTIKKIIENKNKIESIEIINKIGEKLRLNLNKGIIFACGGIGNVSIFMNLFEKKGRALKYNLADHCHFNVGSLKKISHSNILKKYINKSKFEDCLVIEDNKIMCGVQIDSPVNSTLFFKRNSINSEIKFIKIINIFLHKVINFFSKFFKSSKYSLELFFNDENYFNNVISLSAKKNDIFGNKKIDIDYKINTKFFNFAKNNLKKYFYELNNLNKDNFNKENVYVGLHPSSSTPIVTSKEDLTVDINCKINPFNNVFTVGSNVFPTNGITNPTWTIMTFAYRLSNYLNNNEFDD